MGHVFDSGLYHIRYNPEWLEATALDRAAEVTRYAGTNDREAFAETFAIWMAYRRDQVRPADERKLYPEHIAKIMDTIYHRGAWIDKKILQAAISVNGRLFGDMPWKGEETSGVSNCIGNGK